MHLSFSKMSHATPVQFVGLVTHRRKPTITKHVPVSQSRFKSNHLLTSAEDTCCCLSTSEPNFLFFMFQLLTFHQFIRCALLPFAVFEFFAVPQRIVTPTPFLSSVLHHKRHSFPISGPSGERYF